MMSLNSLQFITLKNGYDRSDEYFILVTTLHDKHITDKPFDLIDGISTHQHSLNLLFYEESSLSIPKEKKRNKQETTFYLYDLVKRFVIVSFFLIISVSDWLLNYKR